MRPKLHFVSEALPNACTDPHDTLDVHESAMFPSLPAVASCLDLAANSPGLLFWDVVFRVNFEEMVQDNEDHGRRAEEDGERVELAVGYHIDRAFEWLLLTMRGRRAGCCSAVST